MNLSTRQAWWLIIGAIALGLIFLFLFMVGSNRQMIQRDQTGLEQLRREQASQLVYPQATKLRRIERPKKFVFLEGAKLGPKIRDLYGSQASDEEIATFYTRELEHLGWRFIRETRDIPYTYRELLFLKEDRLAIRIEFWFKDQFKVIFPSLSSEAEKFGTIYEVSIRAPYD